MKTASDLPLRRRARAAFTLMELIGVLAIMAIMSSVLAPNVLRSIERAAVTAEVENMRRIGAQLKTYLVAQGSPPSSSGWVNQLGTYSDLSAADLARNRRGNDRVLIFDPANTPSRRAIVLSSMREGLALPAAGNINSAARFDALWQTANGVLPSTASWSGWSAWSAVDGSADYLVIERVNLLPIYLGELQTFTVTLNNTSGSGPGGGAATSYRVTTGGGTVGGFVTVAANQTASLPLRPKDRVDLYRASGGSILLYSYVISTSGKTFDFDGAAWIPR